jgi:purine-binding chemotaxis protein CheW
MNTDNTAPGPEQKTGIDWNEMHRRIENTREALEKDARPSPAETRAILKKRARILAQEPVKIESKENFMDMVVFRLSQETYGIESVFVREVYPLKDITALPGTPSFVLGIINVRGKILSVIDLKKFFQLPEKGLGDLNKIIIIHNEMMEFGILADVILGTRSIPLNTIQTAPPTISGIGTEYLKGLTRESVIVLDGEKILSDEKMIVNEMVSEA